MNRGGKKIIAGLREAVRHAEGKPTRGRVTKVWIRALDGEPPAGKRTAAYRYEATHILGHALTKGHHTIGEDGYCTQCVDMIVGNLEWAYRAGVRAGRRRRT